MKMWMVADDNVNTAMAIGCECGILNCRRAVEGLVFRDLNSEQMRKLIPKLQVLLFFKVLVFCISFMYVCIMYQLYGPVSGWALALSIQEVVA